MKRFQKIYLVSLLLLVSLFVSCASINSAARDVKKLSTDTAVNDNDSLIVIKRSRNFIGFAAKIIIMVDGQEVAILKNGKSIIYKIERGTHKIQAINSVSANTKLASSRTEEIEFNANSQKVYFATGFHKKTPNWITLILVE